MDMFIEHGDDDEFDSLDASRSMQDPSNTYYESYNTDGSVSESGSSLVEL